MSPSSKYETDKGTAIYFWGSKYKGADGWLNTAKADECTDETIYVIVAPCKASKKKEIKTWVKRENITVPKKDKKAETFVQQMLIDNQDLEYQLEWLGREFRRVCDLNMMVHGK